LGSIEPTSSYSARSSVCRSRYADEAANVGGTVRRGNTDLRRCQLPPENHDPPLESYLLFEQVVQRGVVHQMTVLACLPQPLTHLSAAGRAQRLELGAKLLVSIGRDD
jgi:hypothetical protein